MENKKSYFSVIKSTLFLMVFSLSFQAKASIVEERWKIYFENRRVNSATIPADVYALSELNIKSEVISESLTRCSERQNMMVGDFYMNKLDACPEIKPQLVELKSNFKQFLQSTLVLSPDDFQPLSSDLFSQLFAQIMFDEFSNRDIFKGKPIPLGFGICGGIFDFCSPKPTIPPKLNADDLKLLRLFSYISISGCNLGFHPQDLPILMRKLLTAQGFTQINGVSRAVIFDYENNMVQYISGEGVENLMVFNEFFRRANQIEKDLDSSCREVEK